jgi:hypothetical protein
MSVETKIDWKNSKLLSASKPFLISKIMSLSQQALSGNIAPQALEPQNDHISIKVCNSPDGLRNWYMDSALRQNVLFSIYDTPYASGLYCGEGGGAVGVNGECLCPGGPSGVPYRNVGAGASCDAPFSPIEPGMFPQLTGAAQFLIAQRSPCPASAYSSLDTKPFTRI